MIEAVSSSLVSTQLLRGSVGGVDTSPPAAVREAPKAPYISPHISIDVAHNKAVLQIRDSDTGDVQQQFPTESRLAQISQAQAKLEQRQIVREADIPDAPQQQEQKNTVSAPLPNVQAADIITVQDVTSSASANISLPSPQVAAAALSAGAQSAQSSTASTGVSVLA